MSSILFGCIYLWLDILDKEVVVKSDKHVQLNYQLLFYYIQRT